MNKGRIPKAVGIITIVSLIITLFSGLYNFLLPMYLLHKFRPEIKEAGSIGIIGGADGPTSIFVSGGSSMYMVTIVFLFITIIGFAYLILLRNRKT